MKCKKCGMELGQKNICPSCGPEKTAEKSAAPENPPQAPSFDFSNEELKNIDEFLKAHPSDWSDEFEEFYDKQVFAANYRNTVAMCRHRAELFAAVREMLKDAQKLSADLMLRIMEEIPKKYPEIEENEARALAREFFKGRKQIRQLTLRNTAAVDKFIPAALVGVFKHGIYLSWKRKINDQVYADDELCDIDSSALREVIASCGFFVHALFTNISKSPVKSPWSGRIVSIRTEPVTKLDDVICEIETLD